MAPNTNLVWKLSGTGITAGDVVGGLLQGSFTVDANGKASFTITLAADQLTEGAETLGARIFADSTSTAVLSSASVVVNDTSQAPLPDQPQVLWGTTASDTITGSNAPDQLAGVPATGTNGASMGKGQIDTLTGRGAGDTFLLADSRGGFYNDGNSRNQGLNDYALIKDFKLVEADKLQLKTNTNYLYRNATVSGVAYTEIFLSNGDTSFTAADELIARLEGSPISGSGLNFFSSSSNSLVWVTFV
ncbi:hypothetical protein [Synechococcus sp. GFB01]|uniref:hypothetical protein n=1 Tax=Synechococcus sp. GFB01 TaxID=1662190 RepID=UPI00069DBCA2|nr:hypothetical protein [Synechococcus sp. GFB01]